MAGTERRGEEDALRTERREEETAEPTRGTAGAADAAREQDDPREEEGWTQPESSAQKGVLPDEGVTRAGPDY